MTFVHIRHLRSGAGLHRLRLAAVALLAAGIVAAVVAAILAPGGSGPSSSASRPVTGGAINPGGGAQQSASAPGAGTSSKPNIVFVLTDDLSRNLMTFMPHVQSMERSGLTFKNFFVSDSLCCPSRSSIFTGNFPHDTHVFSNVGKKGGFHIFH
ncbi:MAG TPA: sulfatase-like hydrolase/transferase, partial [Mycobacterium sp.]|nr:sulfatase-like hydrolase/transferase [Mycobacterium sp.]